MLVPPLGKTIIPPPYTWGGVLPFPVVSCAWLGVPMAFPFGSGPPPADRG